jgi:hypothetical protein
MRAKNLFPVIVLLLAASAFSWDAPLNEPIRGIYPLENGKVLAYGNSNVYFLDPASGAFNYFATDFNFSSPPVYAEQINYVAGFSGNDLVSINLLNGHKTETTLGGRGDPVSVFCYGGQNLFYAVSGGKDDFTVITLALELNGTFTQANSSKFSGSVLSCVPPMPGFAHPLFLSSSGIIVPSDNYANSTVVVPMRAISSNIIFEDGKFYAGASGGLIASFSDKGRVFDTVSLPDNPMYLYSDGSGIIAYGTSGRMYRLSKGLKVINSTTIPKGIAIGIYPNGNGYAVLMGDRLVLLDQDMNAIGDFVFNAYGDMPAFSGGVLLIGRNTLVQGMLFDSGCAIASPADYGEAGYLPFRASGNAFSAGNPAFKVDVSVNGGPWKPASGSKSWYADIDPVDYGFGLMTLRCKASDQSDARFLPSVRIYRNPGMQKNTFNASVPGGMVPGKEYAILVYDSLNSSVKGFNISINGGPNTTISSNKFSFTPSSSGAYNVRLSKDGFDDYAFVINVGGLPLLLLVVVALIVIIIALYLFFSFYRK